MLTIRAGKLSFSVSEDGSEILWNAQGLPLRQSEKADLWRAYGDDGYEKEMTVRSSNQIGKAVLEDGVLRIVYDRLVADNGRIFDTTLSVTVSVEVNTHQGFAFDATLSNRCDVRINELQLPFVDLDTACDENRANDVFYHIDGLGRIIPNPWEQVRRANHTEYIASDNHVVWNAMRYPGDAAMGWFGLQSGGHFLYMGRHDPKLKICVLSVGVSPRDHNPRLLIAISHIPCAKKGETVTTTKCFVSLNEGDWRTGSDIYGGYARANWYTPPVVPEWVKNITGWQRVILRHQFGEVLFTYDDLPRIYEEGAKCGLNMMMVFGWWKGRFDNGYPIYEPDEGLGGAEKLKESIRKIQEMGGRVALYTNGQLIDVATDYYREIGHKVCRIDIDGNDYRDHYRFGNDGLMLRAFGYKSFVTACPANEEWQNRVVMHEKMKFDFGADSAFFDQIGAAAPLPCFNEEHFHGPRPDECEIWRVEAFKKLHANCPEEKAVGTEMVNDMVLPYVQYIHGCQLGPIFGPNCFPEMFMRTFPETVQTDRFVHDNKAGTDRQLGNAFIHGYRHDVSPWRGRAHIGQIPELAEKITKILALKEKYRKFFYKGTYVREEDPVLPAGVKYGEFVNGIERMYALWNDSEETKTFVIKDQTITLNAQEVTCVCFA